LALINAHATLVSGSYKHALGEYVSLLQTVEELQERRSKSLPPLANQIPPLRSLSSGGDDVQSAEPVAPPEGYKDMTSGSDLESLRAYILFLIALSYCHISNQKFSKLR
jgi:hypothetical protein